MSDEMTCKERTEILAIKGRAIFAHDLIRGVFYTEQLL